MPICVPLLLRLAVLDIDPSARVENFQTYGCLHKFLQTHPAIAQRFQKITRALEKEEANVVDLQNARESQLTHPDQCIYSDDEWNKYFAASNFLYDAWARLQSATEPRE